jgi:hypothetical protein
MEKENDLRLVTKFPLLYADRSGCKQSTAMSWGFSCGDGWFDIIWELSEKLEPIIKKFAAVRKIDTTPAKPAIPANAYQSMSILIVRKSLLATISLVFVTSMCRVIQGLLK